MAPFVPDVSFTEGRFVQFLHADPGPMVDGLIVFATQSAIRRMVQEIAEDLLAIGCILHRVKDVVVPEDIDGEQRRRLFIWKPLHQVQEAAVFKLHRIYLFQRPAFAGFLVHQFDLDRVEVQFGDRVEFWVRVHVIILCVLEFVTIGYYVNRVSSFLLTLLDLLWMEFPEWGDAAPACVDIKQ
jgi:hypothetical protein